MTHSLIRCGWAVASGLLLVHFGCAGLLGQGDYKAAYENKDRPKLEEACAAYVAKRHKEKNKKAACTRLAELNRDEIFEARKSGDFKLIASICSGETLRDSNASGLRFNRDNMGGPIYAYALSDADDETKEALKGSGNVRFSAQHMACSFNRDKTAGDAAETVDALASRCGDGEEIAKQIQAAGFATAAERKAKIREVSVKLADCDKWGDIFVHLLHQDDGLPAALTKAGKPFEKEFVGFLEQSDFSFNHSRYAMAKTVGWMLDAKRFGQCEAFAARYPTMPERVRNEVVVYFANAKCTNATPLVAANLSHDDPGFRAQACGALAKLGAKAQRKSIERLASSDPTYKMDGLHRVYWVRDTCAKAANKLALQ